MRRIVNVHEDADDVLQNTFVKIWKGLHRYRGDSAIYTWMYRIATNEALSHLRKQQRNPSRIMQNDNEEETNFQLEQIRNDEGPDAETIERKLKEAIDLLPGKQKAVFLLRYYEELKYEEISEVLETSVGALKASYHHAVKKIELYIRTN